MKRFAKILCLTCILTGIAFPVQAEDTENVSYPLDASALEEAFEQAKLPWKAVEEQTVQDGIVQYSILDDADRNAGGIIMTADGDDRYLTLMLMESAIPGKELEFTDSYLQDAVKLVCDCYGGFTQETDIYADYLEDETPAGELWEKTYDDLSCLIYKREGIKEGMATFTIYLYNSEEYAPSIGTNLEAAE